MSPRRTPKPATVRPAFDNVNDYHGFTILPGAGILDVTGTPIPGLNGYSVSVTVAEASGDFPAAASNAVLVNEALRITVLVDRTGRRKRFPARLPSALCAQFALKRCGARRAA